MSNRWKEVLMAEPKEVYFDQYCKTCKYSDLSEDQDPCWDCLEEPMNYDSHKPLSTLNKVGLKKNQVFSIMNYIWKMFVESEK